MNYKVKEHSRIDNSVLLFVFNELGEKVYDRYVYVGAWDTNPVVIVAELVKYCDEQFQANPPVVSEAVNINEYVMTSDEAVAELLKEVEKIKHKNEIAKNEESNKVPLPD